MPPPQLSTLDELLSANAAYSMDAADYSTVIARLGSDHCDAVMTDQPVLIPDPTVLDVPTMEDLLADLHINEQAQQSQRQKPRSGNPFKASSLGCNVPPLNIAALQQPLPPLPSLPAQGANMGAPSSIQAAAPAGLPMPASLDRLLPSGELPRPGSGADSPAASLGITIQQLRQQQAAASQLPGLQQRQQQQQQQQQQGRQATPTEAGQYSSSQGSTGKLLQLQRAHRELELQLNLATRQLEEQEQEQEQQQEQEQEQATRQAMQQAYTAQIPAARRQQGALALPAVPGSPAHMSLHDGSTAAAGAGQQQQQALPSSSVPLPASMQLVGLTGPNLSSTDMQASWQLPLGRLPMPSDLILHQHRNLAMPPALDLSGHNLANGMAMGNLGSLGMGLPSGPNTMRQLLQLLGEGLPLHTCAMADDPCIIAELLGPAPKLPTASAAADTNELLRAAFGRAPGSMPAAAPALRQQQQQQQQLGSTLLGPAPITAAALLAQLGQPSPGAVPALASEQRLSTTSIGVLQFSGLGLLHAGLRGTGSGRCCAACWLCVAACTLLAVHCWEAGLSAAVCK